MRKAVQKAQDVDIWLGAHLGDLAEKVGLLEDESFAETTDLRQELLLKYAQSLLDEQGLWRISIDYLAACGLQGRKKMSQRYLVGAIGRTRPGRGGDEKVQKMQWTKALTT